MSLATETDLKNIIHLEILYQHVLTNPLDGYGGTQYVKVRPTDLSLKTKDADVRVFSMTCIVNILSLQFKNHNHGHNN